MMVMVIEISGSIVCCLSHRGTQAGPPRGRRPAVSAGGCRSLWLPLFPPAPALMAQLYQSGQQQWRRGPGGGPRSNLYCRRKPPRRSRRHNVVPLDHPLQPRRAIRVRGGHWEPHALAAAAATELAVRCCTAQARPLDQLWICWERVLATSRSTAAGVKGGGSVEDKWTLFHDRACHCL